ncbi:MAG: DinB family protein [Leptospiraceae bacterium]|nr:DinB family protein [Leptospiraceae bacterium]MCP5512634.1 DinB family protein [Leptospiraceae bacterium]
MANNVLLEQHKFTRLRLLALLDTLEKSGHGEEALYWKLPFGEKGRAHIAWQVLHCAATLEKYFHIRLDNSEVVNKELVEHFGSGSVPDTNLKHDFSTIRNLLNSSTEKFYSYFNKLSPDQFDSKPFPDSEKTNNEILILLNWHEAEHTGQCQITWNSFKASKGI